MAAQQSAGATAAVQALLPFVPTCANTIASVSNQAFPCSVGTVPNQANASSTTVDQATCCLVSDDTHACASYAGIRL